MDNKYKYLIAGAVLVILVAGFFIYYTYMSQTNEDSTPSNNNYSSSFYLNPLSNNEVDSYKASCQEISLNNLFQNPDAYKGERVKETGQIVNLTVNSNGVTEMLLYTPETNRDFNRLFVTYKGKIPYVPGDKIRVYGEVHPFTVYSIKMPFVKAVYIEKE